MVFPMRISAISSPYEANVELYVCAEHRLTLEGADTEYANRITKPELVRIRQEYPLLGELLPRPCFMTKLKKVFLPDDMNDDVTFERASSDQEYQPIQYTGLPVAEGILLAMALYILAKPLRRRGSRSGGNQAQSALDGR
jgi:hypothetical protein